MGSRASLRPMPPALPANPRTCQLLADSPLPVLAQAVGKPVRLQYTRDQGTGWKMREHEAARDGQAGKKQLDHHQRQVDEGLHGLGAGELRYRWGRPRGFPPRRAG